MSTFDDRKDGFERKFSHDAETYFKIEARACKITGLWLAEKFGLTGTDADTYAKSVVTANLEEPGFDDVKRKVKADMDEKGLEYDESELDAKLNAAMKQAEKEITA